MHSVFYTVTVREKFVLLVREPFEWRIGKLTRAGKLNLFSPKVDLFFDKEDEEKILQVLAAGDEKDVGTVEVVLVPGEKGRVSLRAGGHDQEPDRSTVSGDPMHGDLDKWIEFATWTAAKGIKFNKQAHPVLRKDGDALAEVAAEISGGSGVFHNNIPGDSSIFRGGTRLTEL